MATVPEGPVRGRGRRPAEEVRAGGPTIRCQQDDALQVVAVQGALALDGHFHAVEQTLAFADTGDIRVDLVSQLRAFTHVMTQTLADGSWPS